jgi:hypothetical protein
MLNFPRLIQPFPEKPSFVVIRKKLFYLDAVRRAMIFGGGSVWLRKMAMSGKKALGFIKRAVVL